MYFSQEKNCSEFTDSLSSDVGKTFFKVLNHKLFLGCCHICVMDLKLISLVLLKLYISYPIAYRMTSLDMPPITPWLPLHNQFISPEFLLWSCFLFCLALLIEPPSTKVFLVRILASHLSLVLSKSTCINTFSYFQKRT